MRAIAAIVMVMSVTTMIGCSTMSVTHDHDPDVDFSALKTYAWLKDEPKPTGDPRVDRSLLRKRVHSGVDKELAAKGFVRQDTGTPDFFVGYYVTLQKKASVFEINRHYHYGGGWGYSYGYAYAPPGWGGVPATYVYEYEQGTLLIDIVDADERTLIWRGAATDEVSFRDSPEREQAQLTEAIQRILAGFPPPTKSK